MCFRYALNQGRMNKVIQIALNDLNQLTDLTHVNNAIQNGPEKNAPIF